MLSFIGITHRPNTMLSFIGITHRPSEYLISLLITPIYNTYMDKGMQH